MRRLPSLNGPPRGDFTTVNSCPRSSSHQRHEGLECLGVAGGYESDLFAAKDLGTIGPVGTHRRTRLGIFAGYQLVPSVV
jgi:hypothetical protein